MNNEIKKLHFMLKKAGMHNEAQKAVNIMKKAQGIRDWEEELEKMDHPFDIDYEKEKESQMVPAYLEPEEFKEPKWESKKMPEPTPHYLRQKKLDNNHYGPSDYGYKFPAQGFDDPITHSLESDDEYFPKYEADTDPFEFDRIPEKSQQQRDLSRQVLQDEMEFSSSESKKMKEGLKNMIKQSFPPKGKVEGDGSVYDVDAKKYYAFLKRELGQKISEIGLVSLDGTAKINVDTITNTLFDKYNMLSEARKKNMIGAMIKKGFLKR